MVASRTRTGADRYFARRASEPGYADAYDEARRRIDAIDRLVRALDDRREELGLSKAELARRAELAPEAVRRLFVLALCREPTASELAKFQALLAEAAQDGQTTRREALEDLFWSVLTSREFLFNR